jgi:hypothetical protein
MSQMKSGTKCGGFTTKTPSSRGISGSSDGTMSRAN